MRGRGGGGASGRIGEGGAISIVVVVLVAGLLLVAAGVVDVGRLLAGRAQAVAAADAAALAAAPLTFLPGDPSGASVEYAARNGARLVACRCAKQLDLAPRTVLVEVTLEVDTALFGTRRVQARAAAEFAPLDLLGPGSGRDGSLDRRWT